LGDRLPTATRFLDEVIIVLTEVSCWGRTAVC